MMKKILQFLFFLLTIGFSLVSCCDYEEVKDERPTVNQPTIISIGTTSVTFNEYPNNWDGHYSILVSQFSDMRDAVECECHEYTYQHYNSKTHKYETQIGRDGLVTGLLPNTTYYAQSEKSKECSNGGVKIKSSVIEFKTNAYEPTSYSITIPEIPMSGEYGVFTVGGDGNYKYDGVAGGTTLNPSTKVDGPSTVYLTIPYISGAIGPQNVPLLGGQDFYYAKGEVNPGSPNIKLSPKRYTAHVGVNISFKAAKDEASNVKLDAITIANVNGNAPLCHEGTMDLITEKFTPSTSAASSYLLKPGVSIKSGMTVSRTFVGVLPVKFNDNEVKLVLSLSGDIQEKEVTINIPSSNWSEGSDVTLNFNAQYTATGVELILSNVSVIPWSDGSTGNIDITK